MSQQFNDPRNNTGNYPTHRRRSPQESSCSPPRFSQVPAPPPEPVNIKQEVVHSYDLAYTSQAPIDGSVNYYPSGIPNAGHYGTTQGHQQGHGPGYHQHTQSTISVPYLQGHNTRDIYPQSGVNAQWPQGHHHHHSADFNRSASWSPEHNGHFAPPLLPHGSMSMGQMGQQTNNRTRRQVTLPQRPYTPHHRQNYFDQFIPEGPITFSSRSGGEGIALTDVMNENFDYLVGRDDPMFASYAGPAISLRLEWPGYKSWTKQIKTKDWRREPKPITKAKLAIEVAKKVQNFIQDNIPEPIIPGSERWQVGPAHIEVKDLVLVRLVHVSKGSWQAEFEVLE